LVYFKTVFQLYILESVKLETEFDELWNSRKVSPFVLRCYTNI